VASRPALGRCKLPLKLYTAAKNNHGIARQTNELGDLYLRQGQYNVALRLLQARARGIVQATEEHRSNRRRQHGRQPVANANIADDKLTQT